MYERRSQGGPAGRLRHHLQTVIDWGLARQIAGVVSGEGTNGGELLRWVALHETTHALQFEGVPWLREHMAGLVREVLRTAEISLDAGKLVRLPSGADLRALVEAVRDGDLLLLVTNPEQRAL